MSAQWDSQDKTFLITGGASGLGALYAETFLKEGAKSVAILDVAVEKGQDLAAKLNKSFSNSTTFYECDVGNETQVTDVFNQVVAKFGRVDVIINNAGIMVDTPCTWRHACNVNWQGLVSLTLKGVQHMRKDEGGAGGTIINVASTMAILKKHYLPIYAGCKIAVLHFTQSMAMDPLHEHTGVRLLIFCLDATQTDLLEGMERRSWNSKTGESFAEFGTTLIRQKPESAINALMQMFKTGANGSTWLSTKDRPGKDITSVIDSTFETYESILE